MRDQQPEPVSLGAAEKPSEEVLLNRYRVLARRGTGGFGTVCTCWDTRLQRRVAIKRIPVLDMDDGISASTAEEALGEARTACLLAHPNIVSVLDFEMEGAYAYLIMEYVDGLNLAELLSRVEGGTLSHDECAHMVASVGRALAFAHENGVLHLDIKPTNIMVDRRGTVKLADFGMATLASAAGYGDARGGTVGYMPPEQIQGMLVDERADVFSLAVVTWQALCGTDPFAAVRAADSLTKIFHGPKDPLVKLDPTADLTTQDALMRALAPQASERTACVDDLVDALLPDLGDPAAGQESLEHLVNQSEKDDEAEQTTWRERHLPWRTRYPWLYPALERVPSAAATLLAIRLVLPCFPGATSDFVLLGTLVATAAALAWPPIGSALTLSAAVFAAATSHATSASFPLALLLGAVAAAWWLYAGQGEKLAGAAALLPCCLPFPGAGATMAGFALDPAPAAVTGAVSCALGLAFPTLAATGFYAQQAVPELLALAESPGSWALLAGAALAAAASSAIAMRGSVTSGIIGQSVGLAVLLAAECLAAGVENGGIWAPPNWVHTGLAVLLYAFLCISTVLRGPLFEGQEGEDSL